MRKDPCAQRRSPEGVEVVKVPFKVGKGIYDVVKDDEPKDK